MVAQWLAFPPQSRKVVGSVPGPGAFLCGVEVIVNVKLWHINNNHFAI